MKDEGCIVAEGKIEYSGLKNMCPIYRIGNQLIQDIVAKIEREYGNQPIQLSVKAVRKQEVTTSNGNSHVETIADHLK